MTISEIYERFDVPPGLQTHMIRVAQFGEVVARFWAGPKIDPQFIVICALVHDLGNLVKFTDYFGEDAERKEHWEQVKQALIARYGSDDHEVTKRMLEAAGVDRDVIATVLDKSSANAPAIAASDRWQLKVLLYTDLRIGPAGVLPIKARLAELAARSETHRNRPHVDAAILEIERQLQKQVTCDLSAVTERDFTLTRTDARALEIPTGN